MISKAQTNHTIAPSGRRSDLDRWRKRTRAALRLHRAAASARAGTRSYANLHADQRAEHRHNPYGVRESRE